ncbi:metalloregulator ArsR/SmtB family transcription factor [Spirosoma sp.]|uniref:metalloregulator ArsR/SmtB family transcription factor n=1 Tax=Spirosoma sp. TaxID=1899569 RepID=UPI003B3A8EA0
MIDQNVEQAAELLKTIAHPLRLRILLTLLEKSTLNVSPLQEHLRTDQSLLSQHLTKMKNRGILVSRRQGHEIYYSLADPSLIDEIKQLLNRIGSTD